MPSIALFFSTHTFEDEIRKELLTLSGFTPLDDQQIIDDAEKASGIPREKLEKALYQKTSVFNKFTLERELSLAYLKTALAERLKTSKLLLSGYTLHLIPKGITHILKVLVVDEKDNRINRAVQNGLHQSDAAKQIRADDVKAYHWTDFLISKEPWDNSLYDIVIPLDNKSPEQIAGFISEQCAQGSLLETPASAQAVQDMLLAAQVEINLLKKGQKVIVEACSGSVKINVNKSVLNFGALSKELGEYAAETEGVKEVQVAMGRDYSDSIYRDQEFRLPPKVLLVDDEKDFALTLSERLISRNVGSFAVYGGQDALDFLNMDEPDVMVLDLKMPGVSGMEVLEETKKKHPDVEIIILTGHGTEEDNKSCMELGAFAYLQKPTDIQTLSETINKAHEKKIRKKTVV